jgi:uncharacterized delta-60 repeat protein
VHFNFNLGGRFGSIDDARAVAVDGQGRIVVAGTASTASGLDFAVARLTPDGGLDTIFGSNGLVHFNFNLGGRNFDFANALALDAQGRIVVAGSADTGSGVDFAVARLTGDYGVLDTSFNHSGLQHFNFNTGGFNLDQANAVAMDPYGEIVVAGSAQGAAGTDFALARLDPNGNLDTNFGGNGLPLFNFNLSGSGSDFDVAEALAVDGQGRIVVAGDAQTASGTDFAVVRLKADGTQFEGTLDSTFNGVGLQHFNFTPGGTDRDFPHALAVDGQGRIVVAGDTTGNTSDFAVARLTPDGGLDPSFGGGGLQRFNFNLGTAGGNGAAALALDGQGRIVVAGSASNLFTGADRDFAVARLLGDPPPPPPPPPPGITAALVPMRGRGHQPFLEVVVRYADTGAVKKEFRCPFQPTRYRRISVSILHTDGDGLADAVVLTAQQGKKTFTRTFPV